MTNNKYHRAFGVYGIYMEDEALLVINKNAGPYINRFDLPGGRLEAGETLLEAMKREFLEETGIEIEIVKNIGVTDFKITWMSQELIDVHHIAVFYLVRKVGGKLQTPEQFEGQDSLGAVWVTEKDITIDNASPLVLKAFEWLKARDLGIDADVYGDWKVLI